MPIDLKWIRTNPQEVQEWQRLRQINNGDALVQEVVQLDVNCRQGLSVLTAARTQIKRHQQSLRPQKTKKEHVVDSTAVQAAVVVAAVANIDREEVLQDIKELQTSIPQLQQNWLDISQQVRQALVKIASPIDADVHQILPETTITTNAPLPLPLARNATTTFSFASNLGLDIYEALIHYTRRSFRHYSTTKCPSHVSIRTTTTTTTASAAAPKETTAPSQQQQQQQQQWSLDSSLAHAMWGCSSKQQNCAVCLKQPLNSWLGVIANHHHNQGHKQGQQINKTIYGAKQLPCFTSLLLSDDKKDNNSDAFQILAVTAGTMWDSRRVQQTLLQEILDFLSSLQIVVKDDETNHQQDSHTTTTQSPFHALTIDPSQLELHESSRVIVLASTADAANNSNDNASSRPSTSNILATISNFGDASSRACDLQFAGGGSRHSGCTKDYCHLVVATIHIDKAVLPWMLLVPQQRQQGQGQTTKHTKVAIPRVIAQHMVLRDMEEDGDDQDQDYILVPVQELLQEKNTPVFAPRKDNGTSKADAASGTSNGDKGQLPFEMTDFLTRQTSEKVRMEALTSPFDFLFR
jgi:hypothetical protein